MQSQQMHMQRTHVSQTNFLHTAGGSPPCPIAGLVGLGASLAGGLVGLGIGAGVAATQIALATAAGLADAVSGGPHHPRDGMGCHGQPLHVGPHGGYVPARYY